MNRILKIVSVVAFAAASLLPTHAADAASVVNFVSATTLTNNVTRTAALGNPIKIDRQGATALVVRFQGNGSDTANIIVKLARSGDGTNFETSPPSTLLFTNALNNATAVIAFHQISPDLLRSVHSVKLVSVQNAASSVSATNVYIGLVIKQEVSR